MQSRTSLINDIIAQMCSLCGQPGINIDAALIRKALGNRTSHDTLTIAWNLLDEIEIQFPYHSLDITHTRIELHALQDELALIEIHTLSNENDRLQARVTLLEQQNQQLRAKLASTESAHSRTPVHCQLFQPDTTNTRNPHSPYTSPDFTRRNS